MAIPFLAYAIMSGCGGGSPLYVGTHTISQTGVIVKGSGSATASLLIESAGTLSASSGTPSPAFNDTIEWAGASTPGDYHVRVTATGDTADMGGFALNTWYECNIDRAWNVSVSGGASDSASVVLTLEFSDDGGSTVFATFSSVITLFAEIL